MTIKELEDLLVETSLEQLDETRTDYEKGFLAGSRRILEKVIESKKVQCAEGWSSVGGKW